MTTVADYAFTLEESPTATPDDANAMAARDLVARTMVLVARMEAEDLAAEKRDAEVARRHSLAATIRKSRIQILRRALGVFEGIEREGAAV